MLDKEKMTESLVVFDVFGRDLNAGEIGEN